MGGCCTKSRTHAQPTSPVKEIKVFLDGAPAGSSSTFSAPPAAPLLAQPPPAASVSAARPASAGSKASSTARPRASAGSVRVAPGVGGAGDADFELYDLPVDVNGLTALHRAARDGDAAAIRGLLEKGVDASYHLRLAAAMRYTDEEMEAEEKAEAAAGSKATATDPIGFAAGPALDARRVRKRHTPLHDAAAAGRVEAVRLLLDAGSDAEITVDEPKIYGYLRANGAAMVCTALDRACEHGRLEVVRLLLERLGADPPLLLSGLLMAASRAGNAAVVRELLQRGAEVDGRPPQNKHLPVCALHLAARAADPEAVRLILEKGPKAEDVKASLPWAADGGNADVIRMLVQAGADPGHYAGDRGSFHPCMEGPPLCLAARRGHLEAVRALLDAGAPMSDKKENRGQKYLSLSPLWWAAEAGHAAVCRLLLERGAPVDVETQEKVRPADVAARFGHVDALRALIEGGAALTREDDRPAIPALAAAHSDARIVRALEAKGIRLGAISPEALVEVTLAESRTAACRGIDPLYALDYKLVIECGPLAAAAARGDAASVRFLAQRGADPNEATARIVHRRGIPTKDRLTDAPTIFLAASFGHCDAIRTLVEVGARLDVFARRTADVATTGAAGHGSVGLDVVWGPLEEAVRCGRADAVRLLLQLGCPPVAAPPRTRAVSALHFAVDNGDAEAVRALLERGHLPAARRGRLPSPYDLAARWDRPDLLTMLLQRRPLGQAALDRCLAEAAREGAVGTLRLLLQSGARAASRVQEGRPIASVSPLVLASAGGHYDCARLLLEAGADAHDGVARPAFASQRYAGVGDTSDDDEEDPDPFEAAGPSAVQLAAEFGHGRTIRLLARHGAAVETAADVAGPSALGWAVHRGNLGAARALLECGADAARPEALPEGHRKGASLLHAAVSMHDAGIVRALLEVGRANPAAADAYGETPLSGLVKPARNGAGGRYWAPTLRTLLEFGADPWAPIKSYRRGKPEDRTILSFDDDGGGVKPELFSVLQEMSVPLPRTADTARAMVVVVASAGQAYSWDGALQRAMTTLRGMIAQGIDPGLRFLPPEDRERVRPGIMHAAVSAAIRGRQSDAVLELLLQSGGDPNERSEKGERPLHVALGQGHEQVGIAVAVTKRLLEAGADINAPDGEGTTAFASCIRGALASRGQFNKRRDMRDSSSLLPMLIAAGADIGARCKGVSHAAEAARQGDVGALKLLLEHGALASARDGELLAAASQGEAGEARREILRMLLETEREAAARGAAFEVQRDKAGKLEGRAAGFVAAVRAVAADSTPGAADDAVSLLDLLLSCRGVFREAELEELTKIRAAPAGAARESVPLPGQAAPLAGPQEAVVKAVEAARACLREEGRLEGAGAGAGRPEAALAAAIRGGFRATALRLARAAPDVEAGDEAGLPPLYHAVAAGPAMRDVCLALIQRGADLAAQVGTGDAKRGILDATNDVAFRAQLKRAAAVRDVFISYGHHPPDVARFTGRLRDRLQAGEVMCWMDEMKPSGIEAGTEWREQIGRGIKASRAVVFVASKHSCASDWCALELSRARDLGRPVLPVWRERVELDARYSALLDGCTFTDFSTDEAFEQGFSAFFETLEAALKGAAGDDGGDPLAAARALVALPQARFEAAAAGGARPLALWCPPEDAGAAKAALAALASRGVRCWVDCPLPEGEEGGPASPLDADKALALARSAALVPLLSPAAAAPGPAARLRALMAAAARLGRPVRPLIPSPLEISGALEYSLARTRLYPFFCGDEDSFFPGLDRLLVAVARAALSADKAGGPRGLAAGWHGPAELREAERRVAELQPAPAAAGAPPEGEGKCVVM